MRKSFFNKVFLLFMLLCLSLLGQAQVKTITGTVTSGEGAPLAGVTVTAGTAATATNDAGAYKIQASEGSSMTFSFVGYASQTVVVGSEDTISIVLQSGQSNLDEVVVVGYGTQRKGNLTGAVSTVDLGKSLSSRPIADVGRALQGAASGLSITVPSGEVGSDPLIKIRGQVGSLNGGSAPLILLDNVEIPSIQVVNPTDIESITVLKDAASASIYGAKAAFGVILITTKKGSGTGKPIVYYTNNFSWQNVWKDLKMADVNGLRYTVDAAERIGTFTPVGAFYYVDRASYEKAVEWKNKYGGSIGPDDPTVFGRDWYVQGASNQKMGVRTYDPYDYMVREWAPTAQHNLSIGARTGKTSYNIGLGTLDQSGMLKPAKLDNFRRDNASLRVSSEINKYLTVRAGAIYSARNKQYAYATNSTTADPWLYLYRWSSLYPLGKDENGDPIRSPESEIAAANTASIKTKYMNLNLGATVHIMKNWRFDFDYTYTDQDEIWSRPGTRFTARNSWVAPKERLDADGNPVYVNSEGQIVAATDPGAIKAFDLSSETYTAPGSNPDHFARTVTNFYSSTINAYTTYNWKIEDDHNFKFLLGVNRVAGTTEWQSSQINNLSNIENPQFPFGTGTETVAGDKTWEAQLGYFGRINYAFRNKYLLEGNLRYDGSSKFPSDLWWRWYPSFSAGWVATEETFMNWAKPVLSFLKIRGSWGSIGDQTVPNNLYLPIMPSGKSTWINAVGARVPYVGSPLAIDPNIYWQNIVSSNIGFDMGFFENKINVSFDLFKRNTDDMIVPLEGIPFTFGATPPLGNYGSLSTKGWELTVDFNHRFENGLGINLRGNISDARTILTKIGTGKQVNGNYDGKDIGEIWGYRTDRLYQYADFELDGNGKPILITLTADESPLYAGRKAYKLKAGPNGEKPVYQPYLQNSDNFFFGPGDVKFKDINGDGEINDGKGSLSDHGDLQVIGNSTPRYEWGAWVGLDYKGVDISAFFQGVGKREIWGVGFLTTPGFNASDGAMPEAIASNYWRPDNTGAFYPAAYNNAGANNSNNMQVQDRYLLNMAYTRLKNLTLGYTLPESLTKKIWVNSLRVYGALENFFTWDHLGDLPIDPESISGYSMWNTSNYNSGRTGTGIPAFKSFSFGLQLIF
ncbi:SusC/RagA family TonB-linked outer membrane protein [Niabella beijingensis]|uniref:SusC/RagA family TonB-linked outer membrane protein n=1 Tax=Niabella beijingensis TaxID=2872700 RepID=UPI001CBBE42D|nr:SusC/RagA family TonB-linked outer membrane protein [Niabella beijingensis]MBZ4188183.1 SusC/RagA family TonB-linked outer membrane protein [Niabella beijingensis]